MSTISRRSLIVGLGISIVVGFAIGAYNAQNNSDQFTTQVVSIDRTAMQSLLGASGKLFGISAQEERLLLPTVTEVETWQQVGTFISEEQNFAPDIVPLREGGYRIYWNDYNLGGITSATSEDGLSFTPDPGLRLTTASEETACIASHPWTVALENGYRIYYQAACLDNADPGADSQKIFTAFSEDGLTFTREGVAIDGSEMGLTYTGHGRIQQLTDGTYRMYFSANTVKMDEGEPSAILGATSTDGLNWTIDETLTLEMGHDPAVASLDGTIHMYTSFLGKNLLHLVSQDGYTFTPVAWVEFYNTDGRRFEEFGDVEILVKDGEISIYGGGKLVGDKKGYPGQILLREVEEL